MSVLVPLGLVNGLQTRFEEKTHFPSFFAGPGTALAEQSRATPILQRTAETRHTSGSLCQAMRSLSLLFDSSGRVVKLGDFGIAKVLDHTTSKAMTVKMRATASAEP